jgi:hypothetical protein
MSDELAREVDEAAEAVFKEDMDRAMADLRQMVLDGKADDDSGKPNLFSEVMVACLVICMKYDVQIENLTGLRPSDDMQRDLLRFITFINDNPMTEAALTLMWKTAQQAQMSYHPDKDMSDGEA